MAFVSGQIWVTLFAPKSHCWSVEKWWVIQKDEWPTGWVCQSSKNWTQRGGGNCRSQQQKCYRRGPVTPFTHPNEFICDLSIIHAVAISYLESLGLFGSFDALLDVWIWCTARVCLCPLRWPLFFWLGQTLSW